MINEPDLNSKLGKDKRGMKEEKVYSRNQINPNMWF